MMKCIKHTIYIPTAIIEIFTDIYHKREKKTRVEQHKAMYHKNNK